MGSRRALLGEILTLVAIGRDMGARGDGLERTTGSTSAMDRELQNQLPSPSERIKGEIGPMLALAVPVVVAELGWMAMGIVDTIMVGPLGAEATGAVGLGSNLYIAVVIFGIGLLLGLDPMVAREHGAGRDDEARRSLAQGVYLALALSPVLMGLIHVLIPFLPGWGLLDAVLSQTIPYLEALTWSTAPLLIFSAFRRYLQAVNVVKSITFALVTANLINALACWALVYGRFGLPAMGVAGSGWATLLARVYLMAVALASFAIWGREQLANPSWSWPKLEPARLGRLFTLGWPAALHLGLEVGVFAIATALAGRLDAVSLAAHQIVLNVSSLTFMVPLGIASAGAVRVGQALGRGDGRAASTSGWAALVIGAGFMTVSGVSLLIFSRSIVALFTKDPGVIATSVQLFLLAAAFQLFDGIQVVASGVLRGVGDTRSPMICNLFAHWGIGLPLSYFLAFGMGRGVVGLWIGLTVGLILAGLVNLGTWAWRSRRLDRAGAGWIDSTPAPVAVGPPGVL